MPNILTNFRLTFHRIHLGLEEPLARLQSYYLDFYTFWFNFTQFSYQKEEQKQKKKEEEQNRNYMIL